MIKRLAHGFLFGLGTVASIALCGWAVTGSNSDNLTATAVTVIDNTVSAFSIGSTGRTNAITLDTTNDAEVVGFNVPIAMSPAVWETFGEGSAKGVKLLRFDGTTASTSALIFNYAHLGSNTLGYENIGGSSNTTQPAMTATGFDIGGEQTNTDGWEVLNGTLSTSGRSFIIGTDPAFTFCATIVVADASGASSLRVGFRDPEISRATLSVYNDQATIGLTGTADPNTIQILTASNGGATTTTDTTNTWADAASKVLCVLVSATGVVTYTINGIAPSTTAAFTFPDGILVIPFIWFLHGVDLAGTVEITLYDVRFQ